MELITSVGVKWEPLATLNIYYYSSVDDQCGRVWSHSFAPLQTRKRKELELDEEKTP